MARGVLDGVSVRLAGGDITVDQPGFTGFDSDLFRPRLQTTDAFEILGTGAGATYTITFGAPIRDPIFHFYSLASRVVFFDTTNVVKVSGDSTLIVSSNTVSGTVTTGGLDSRGTVRLEGDFTSVSFSVTYGTGNDIDGISIQVGGIDPSVLRTTIHVSEVAVCWNSQAGKMYQGQYRSEFALGSWENLGAPVAGDGTRLCITDPVLDGEKRYYRVKEVN
jgi:hypothetical protein